jgi:hypothetical protein
MLEPPAAVIPDGAVNAALGLPDADAVAADTGRTAADLAAGPADSAGGMEPPAAPPLADAAAAEGAAACASDDDCRLVSDCCSCTAIPRGEKAPFCDPKRSCVVSVCAQYQGLERARCAGGRCVLGFDCDPASIQCKRLAPLCPVGQVPRVMGGCYGECVDARQCLSVASCSACGAADACVPSSGAASGLHCQGPPGSR